MQMHVKMLKRIYFAAELKPVLRYTIPTHLIFCFVDLALNLGHLSAVSIDGGLDVPSVWLGDMVYRDIYVHVHVHTYTAEDERSTKRQTR